MFGEPPNVVVPQGVVTQDQIQAAWEAGVGGRTAIGERVYVAFAVHQELQNAVNDGEKELVANLSSECTFLMLKRRRWGRLRAEADPLSCSQ